METPLVLVGCGKMGGAMLTGWLDRGLDAGRIHVVEPGEAMDSDIYRSLGINVVADANGLDPELVPGVIVFAVKPQVLDDVAPAYARYSGPKTVFLSIAAGKPIPYFKDRLGAGSAIIRAMPNTPAAVRRGITVACATAAVGDDQRRVADDLLEAVGEVAWVDDEELIDAVTALSGGGPAYVFLLAEVMAQAGMDAGLPEDLAKRLARVTVSGAGELLHQAQEPLEILRKNVTSPGGTTAEALKILMADDGWLSLMTRAIAAATQRSKELAD